MLIDARSLPHGHTLDADVCVIGAGAAGLTLAREFDRHDLRVVLLESGGVRARHATQRLFEGTTSGHSYYDLDACRYRTLGGTTSAWGGWCRPLEPIDFEERDWLPGSGWPFDKEQLRAAYERARATCLLGTEQTALRGERETTATPPPNDTWQDVIFEIQPLRFGRAYRSLVEHSRHIDLLLNATVTELVMDRTNRTTMSASAVTPSRRRVVVSAGTYVLAAGGIENARLLLASRQASARGIGDDHDLVGRYFGDHLHAPLAVVRASDDLAERYSVHRTGDVSVRGGMSLSEAGQRRERQPGFAITLHDADDPHDILSPAQARRSYVSLLHLLKSIGRLERPDRAFHHTANVVRNLPEAVAVSYRRFVKRPARTFIVGCRAEQIPNPDSRVTLDSAVDAAGMPKVRLSWQPSQQDLDGIRNGQELLARAFRGQSMEVLPSHSAGSTGWVDLMSGAAHHVGTTRMHRDPRHGVVDEHCRVHDTTNVYVAGSSVFPTGGWAPPTLTIVALAVRLADHLAGSGPGR